MPTNQYQAFGTGVGANTLNAAAYAATSATPSVKALTATFEMARQLVKPCDYPKFIEKLGELVDETGSKLVVIDPLLAYLPSELARANDNQQVRPFMLGLDHEVPVCDFRQHPHLFDGPFLSVDRAGDGHRELRVHQP